jgi:hypothetical protein
MTVGCDYERESGAHRFSKQITTPPRGGGKGFFIFMFLVKK